MVRILCDKWVGLRLHSGPGWVIDTNSGEIPLVSGRGYGEKGVRGMSGLNDSLFGAEG